MRFNAILDQKFDNLFHFLQQKKLGSWTFVKSVWDVQFYHHTILLVKQSEYELLGGK